MDMLRGVEGATAPGGSAHRVPHQLGIGVSESHVLPQHLLRGSNPSRFPTSRIRTYRNPPFGPGKETGVGMAPGRGDAEEGARGVERVDAAPGVRATCTLGRKVAAGGSGGMASTGCAIAALWRLGSTTGAMTPFHARSSATGRDAMQQRAGRRRVSNGGRWMLTASARALANRCAGYYGVNRTPPAALEDP